MKIPQHKQGFTLPEIVVTSLLITVVMLPVSNLAYQSTISTRVSRDLGTAISLGQTKLELLGGMDPADVFSGEKQVDGFRMTWEITEIEELKRVTLTLRWQTLNRTMTVPMHAVLISNFDAGFSMQ